MRNSKILRVATAETLYTVGEIAKLMRVCEKTVRNEIDANHLGYAKVRGSLRIPESEYRAYIERNIVRSLGNGR